MQIFQLRVLVQMMTSIDVAFGSDTDEILRSLMLRCYEIEGVVARVRHCLNNFVHIMATLVIKASCPDTLLRYRFDRLQLGQLGSRDVM